MRALSFIQPWGSAVLTMGKDIENRPWAPPKHLIGKRFAVHAGAKLDKDDAWSLRHHLPDAPAAYPQRAILGTVELVGYVQMDGIYPVALFDESALRCSGLSETLIWNAVESKWHANGAKFLWVLRSPRVLPEPIPCKGALGLWRVPEQHIAALEACK